MGRRELVQMAKLFVTIYESHLGIVMSFRPISASHKVMPFIRNVGHSSLSQLKETVLEYSIFCLLLQYFTQKPMRWCIA